MGAADLLLRARTAGFVLNVADGKLLVTPASKLTDDMRTALRAAKPELLVLLSAPDAEPRQRAYRLSAAEADRCHAEPWDDAAIARFVARVVLFLRRGFDATDADDLAERLHLRDVQGDDLACCTDCRHYRPGCCGNHERAGLLSADVGRDLAAILQRCPGFAGAAAVPLVEGTTKR